MRLVLDTNVVLSALLWSGPPSQLLRACLTEDVQLFACTSLVHELRATLDRPKLQSQVGASGLTPAQIVDLYSRTLTIVEPGVAPRMCRDPDDDIVLATGLAASADIVTGDRDLLSLTSYREIRILSVSAALREFSPP